MSKIIATRHVQANVP